MLRPIIFILFNPLLCRTFLNASRMLLWIIFKFSNYLIFKLSFICPFTSHLPSFYPQTPQALLHRSDYAKARGASRRFLNLFIFVPITSNFLCFLTPKPPKGGFKNLLLQFLLSISTPKYLGIFKSFSLLTPPWGGMGVKPVDLWNRLFISESFDRISRRSSPALQAYG